MAVNRKIGIASVVLLAAAQILIWGGTFFLLAVLATPILLDTGWSRAAVFGALSLSIFVSGLLAPAVGRRVASHGGRGMLIASGFISGAGLLMVASAHNLVVFYLGWLDLGVAMALGLYDALYATLGRSFQQNAKGAITSITLFSGLCTSIVWPGIAWLIEWLGWRGACQVYALILLVTVGPIYFFALPREGFENVSAKANDEKSVSIGKGLFVQIAAIFTIAAIIMAAMSILLVSILHEQGYSLPVAIALAGLLGPSQVAVRILDLAIKAVHPKWMTLASVGSVLAGILLILAIPDIAFLGVVIYGAGNGLRSIVRGTLPLAITSSADYPVLLGRLARPALIGQAASPLVSGWLYEHYGAHQSLLVLAALSAINTILCFVLIRGLSRPRTAEPSAH
ncbi:MFS transporter [Herbaspirillum sp. 1130]|uniref:MFS transporter n=1 Tax=Herbaspirillum sp. 1130 TaxID=2806562 RepID=UPI001AEB1515|nr:MFS transporter [Herbaspirillum sp. 1130]MBP1318307.1 MFS family permease [Herbaspirillum sp. 1130]